MDLLLFLCRKLHFPFVLIGILFGKHVENWSGHNLLADRNYLNARTADLTSPETKTLRETNQRSEFSIRIVYLAVNLSWNMVPRYSGDRRSQNGNHMYTEVTEGSLTTMKLRIYCGCCNCGIKKNSELFGMTISLGLLPRFCAATTTHFYATIVK